MWKSLTKHDIGQYRTPQRRLLKWCGDREIWIMNKKQLKFMWCGIVAIVLAGLQETRMFGYGSVDWSNFILWTILISLVVGGLIYTFRDKKDKKPKADQKQ